MKELTNDQRSKLEQIARDEFDIRKRELIALKTNEFSKWMEEENDKMKRSPMVKRYFRLRKEMNDILDKIVELGFSIGNDGETVIMLKHESWRGTTNKKMGPHPKFEEMEKKTMIDKDAFTRALNEVLSVIWSMEKPFSECIKLIKEEVKKIK